MPRKTPSRANLEIIRTLKATVLAKTLEAVCARVTMAIEDKDKRTPILKSLDEMRELIRELFPDAMLPSAKAAVGKARGSDVDGIR